MAERHVLGISGGKDSAAKATWETTYMAPARKAQQDRIRRELKGVETITVPGSHASFMFVSRDSIAAAMRRFLR